jgi:hypothetical protein
MPGWLFALAGKQYRYTYQYDIDPLLHAYSKTIFIPSQLANKLNTYG